MSTDITILAREFADALDKTADQSKEGWGYAQWVLRQSALEIERLREELRPGSKTERAPTQDAYDKACAALWRHRNRLDWLAGHVVNVKLPLRWGSRELFCAKPDEDGTPSDLVEMIDAAMISDAAVLSSAVYTKEGEQ